MNCEEVIKANLGLSRCQVPAMLKGMIELPAGTEITLADFQLLSAWNTKLLAAYGSRAYLFPWFKGVENQSEDAVYEQTPLSTMAVRDGQYRWKVFLKESLCLHTKLYTHRSSGGVADLVLIDVANNFLGTLNDEGTHVRGFSVDLLHSEKLLLSDGAVSTKSPIYIALRDNTELDVDGVMFKNTFVNQLYRIVDVELVISDVTGDDTFKVTVTQKCDGTPVSGLLLADFLILNAAGADQAVTTVVENVNVPGEYLVTKVDGLVDGTVNLRAASLLTVKAYESTGAVALNIV